MLTFHKVLQIYGVDTNSLRLVRHSNKEIPVLEMFKAAPERLEAYQSYQTPGKFGKATSIAVFAPHYGTTAMFLSLWNIVGCTKNSDFTEAMRTELQQYDLPTEWYNDHVRYKLERNASLDELSERLVIEWGGATVSWVQAKDKEVIELKARKSVSEFESFSLVDLSYEQLKTIVKNPDTNPTWITALSSVNGVYLIKDKSTGKLYVGSAYGTHGIYGRWSDYAKTGHGGNTELKKLCPDNFQFCILEVVSATTTSDEVIACENRWKEKLGTKQFGLNNN